MRLKVREGEVGGMGGGLRGVGGRRHSEGWEVGLVGGFSMRVLRYR